MGAEGIPYITLLPVFFCLKNVTPMAWIIGAGFRLER